MSAAKVCWKLESTAATKSSCTAQVSNAVSSRLDYVLWKRHLDKKLCITLLIPHGKYGHFHDSRLKIDVRNAKNIKFD